MMIQNKDGDKTALDIIELIVKDQRFDDKVLYTDDKRLKTGIFLKRGGGSIDCRICSNVEM